jgi:acetate kinase
VLTAAIGENSRSLRERVCRDAAWLGIDFDATANQAHGPRISPVASRVSAWVVPANEELLIARHRRDVVAGIASAPCVPMADRHPPDAQ